MKKIKKITAVFSIMLIGFTAMPQIAKANYCEDAYWECRDKTIVDGSFGGWHYIWNIGAQWGCSIGYNDCMDR